MSKLVVPHHNYHPESWSEQAREMSNRIAANVNSGAWTIKEGCEFFQHSYRHPLIRNRAAKRFGRLVREGKVHEKSKSY
jgi:hypothetical protein